MRIAITEVGNNSSGDQAILVGAARRLTEYGAQVTLFERVDQSPWMQRAGLDVAHVSVPIPDPYKGIGSLTELVETCRTRTPEVYARIGALLQTQDLVALAPGCRYVDGYDIGRAVLTGALALERGLPLLALHQSVGPIEQPHARRLVAELLGRCALVFVRDTCSQAFLRVLGVPEERIVLSGDMVWNEAYPAGGPAEFDLGLNIRYGFNGHVTLDGLLEFLRGYKRARPGARVLVYSTTFDLAPAVLSALAPLGCAVEPRLLAYPDFLRGIGRCAIHVSDSYHGVLFSIKGKRPVICLQPDWATWKLEGLDTPAGAGVPVLPGLVSAQEARRVLARVLQVEQDPAPVLAEQARLAEYATGLCRASWPRLEEQLRAIGLNRDSSYERQGTQFANHRAHRNF